MSLPDPKDDGNLFIILFTADLPNPPMTLDEQRDTQEAAHRSIRAKYDAGIPLFTKTQIQDVVRQLELESDSNLDQKVSVTGLDGLAVHFPIETGKEYPDHGYGDDYICIITKPQLAYHSIERLLAPESPYYYYYSVPRAYLPVEVVHSTEIRRVQTNELVYPWPVSDYAAVKRRFKQAKLSLEASEHFAQLKSTLASAAIPPGITKIVALACSTMTQADDGDGRSMAQHILALMIRDLLASGSPADADGESAGRIKCYAQDPIYTPVDEQVLSEAGFTVLDDPRAFLEIDEASVVIAKAPDIPVRQIVADIARPAIMIWDKVIFKENPVKDDPSVTWTDPVSPRVTRMIEEYIELPFPAEAKDVFGELTLYVRKGEWTGKCEDGTQGGTASRL